MKQIRTLPVVLLLLSFSIMLFGCAALLPNDESSSFDESSSSFDDGDINDYLTSYYETFSSTEEEVLTVSTKITEGEYYYDVEHVVLYIDAYGCLPENYITKSEAKTLGWSGGSVENYLQDAAIGGDHFGNREALLPEGLYYIECDIDTNGADSRGAKRLVFSLDTTPYTYYFTEDHYSSFAVVYIDENGDVVYG